MNSRLFRSVCRVGAVRFIASMLTLVLLANTKIAAQDFWQQTNGPYGGTVHALAINSSGHIFAGTEGGGVFRSTDDGESWMPANSGLGSKNSVESLAINTNGNIFAGVYGIGVVRSTDNGDRWMLVNNGLTSTAVQCLAINARGHIFAGVYYGGGIFRSIDNGESWELVNNGLPNPRVYALAINSGGHIFAGTHDGVFRSTDNGDSWILVNNGLTSTYVTCLAINSSGHIFAGVYYGGGVYRSTDNGNSWAPVKNGLDYLVYSIAIKSNGYIFAGSILGVYLSTNNGDNWTQVDSSAYILSMAINASENVLAGTWGDGIIRSIDNGNRWTPINTGLSNTGIQSIAIDTKGHVFAGAGHSKIYRSDDNGDSWMPINGGLTTDNVGPLAINAVGHIFAGTDGGVFRSLDNGDSWTVANNGLTRTVIKSLAINTIGYIFAGTRGGEIFRSTNDGDSWIPVNAGLTNNDILALAINASGHIFAGTWIGGVFRSTDNGDNWTPVNNGLASNNVRALAINASGHIFSGTDYGVFRSTDNGDNWTPVKNGLASNYVQALAINSNGHIFAGTVDGGVFRSMDNGDNWAPVKNGLTSDYVQALAINSSQHIFAGTEGSGIFRSVQSALAPQIIHTPVTIANSGQNIAISITATDNLSIQSATLYYRQGGAMSFQSTPMNDTGGDNYAATIPAGIVTERGLEYYISVTDPSNNTATYPASEASTHPQAVRVRSANLTRASQTPAMAYRMISVPIELDNASPRNVLEDDWGNYNDTQWRLLRYLNGEDLEYTVNSSFDNFDPGKGFWLITRHPQTLAAGAGLSVTTAENFTIILQPGWNQIGNPFAFPVNWSEVVKSENVESRLVGYQGSLNEVSGYDHARTRLEPWEGYFVNNLGSSATTIAIPPVATSGALAKSGTILETMNLQENEWGLQISAAYDRYLDKDNYLGCLSDAADAWDRNDFSEAPFFDKQVSLYFPHQDWQTFPGRYTGDFRAVNAEGLYWDFEVKTNINNAEVKLSLSEIENLPTAWKITLLDERSRISVDMLKDKGYVFWPEVSETIREFRILVGPESYVDTNDEDLPGIPKDYALLQNYPNPFNPTTTIGFTLPEPSHVRLTIYDVTGQLTKMLLDTKYGAGIHQVEWDGRATSGEKVASGVYLYNLRADKFEQTRKMVLAQ